MGYAIVAILAIVCFGLAYMSWKTSWRWFHTMLAVYVFFAAMAMIYFSAMTLKTHQTWRNGIARYDEALRKENEQNRELVQGDDDNQGEQDGITKLNRALHNVLVDRGEVWAGIGHLPVKQDGTVPLQIQAPAPHGVQKGMLLYLFEQRNVENGGHFLGEFRVVAADDKSPAVTVVPNLPPTQDELKVLIQSKDPWIAFATIPLDDVEFFDSLTDAEKQAVPADIRDIYIEKGRKARDYLLRFHKLEEQRAVEEDILASVQSDLERVTADMEKAKGELAYRTKEKAELNSDLSRFKKERQAVADYTAALRKQDKDSGAARQVLLRANQKLAAELTVLQLKAAEEINRRAAALQQASARDNSPSDRP